ncbi:MAG: ABC transporter substrate-binding protein [Saccharofermentanales bacterium]
MKKSLKIMAFILALAFQAVNIAGCSQNVITLEVVKKHPKKILKISEDLTGDDLKAFQGILKELNERSNEYSLEIQEIPVGNYTSQLESLINTGMAPDLIMPPSGSLASLIYNNKLLDISAMVANDKTIEMDDYCKSTTSSVIDDDKLFGIPFSCSPILLFYNKNKFSDAKVPFPDKDWKWEDFRKAAKTFTRDTDGDGNIDEWGIDSIHSIDHVQFLRSYSITPAVMDTPQAVKAFAMFEAIVDDRSYPKYQEMEDSYTINRGPFEMGKTAMKIGLMDMKHFKKITDEGDEICVAEMPFGNNRGSLFYENVLVINGKTKFEDMSYKAFSDLISAFKKSIFIPPLKNGFNIAAYKRLDSKIDMNVVKNSLEYGEDHEIYNSYSSIVAYNSIEQKYFNPIMRRIYED